MLLDIELVKEVNMFCVESAAATVAVFLKRHYEMMYFDMYGFDFQYEKANQTGNIGDNLQQGYSDEHFMENLEKYHGIRMTEKAFKESEGVDTLLNELHKNMPVALGIDRICCGWGSDREILLLLLVGECEEGFLCYNVHEVNADPKLLEYSRLEECYKEKYNIVYYVFESISDERTDITLDLFVDYMRKQIYPYRDDILLRMKKLAECIREKFDLNKEMKSPENFFHMPFFSNLSNVLRARRLTSQMLNYIYSVTGDPRAKQYAHILEQVGVDWKFLWSSLGKMGGRKYEMNDPSYKKKLNDIADGIEKIAEKEYEFIIGVCEDKIHDLNKLRECEPVEYLINPKSSISRIELEAYCNNQAFARTADNQERADISGQGECFYLDENQELISIEIGGREIEMPIIQGVKDNIVCRGQKIILNGVACKQIILVACAVWRDVYNSIKISCSDECELEILAKIPDWYNWVLDAREVWSGNIIDVNGKACMRSIYGYVYDIGDKLVNSIVLPNDDALHIFGIYIVN